MNAEATSKVWLHLFGRGACRSSHGYSNHKNKNNDKNNKNKNSKNQDNNRLDLRVPSGSLGHHGSLVSKVGEKMGGGDRGDTLGHDHLLTVDVRVEQSDKSSHKTNRQIGSHDFNQ